MEVELSSICMKLPRYVAMTMTIWRFLGGLLRGYGDRREEASFASKSVDYMKKTKKNI